MTDVFYGDRKVKGVDVLPKKTAGGNEKLLVELEDGSFAVTTQPMYKEYVTSTPIDATDARDRRFVIVAPRIAAMLGGLSAVMKNSLDKDKSRAELQVLAAKIINELSEWNATLMDIPHIFQNLQGFMNALISIVGESVKMGVQRGDEHLWKSKDNERTMEDLQRVLSEVPPEHGTVNKYNAGVGNDDAAIGEGSGAHPQDKG